MEPSSLNCNLTCISLITVSWRSQLHSKYYRYDSRAVHCIVGFIVYILILFIVKTIILNKILFLFISLTVDFSFSCCLFTSSYGCACVWYCMCVCVHYFH